MFCTDSSSAHPTVERVLVCGLDVSETPRLTSEISQKTIPDLEVSSMKKEEKKSKLGIIIGGVALTAAGLIIIPPIIAKYSNKMYKSSLKNNPIDFDNLGPEIVPTEEKKEGEK